MTQSEARPHVLMQVRLAVARPSLADAAKRLGVPLEALDAAYGLVPTDPEAGLYAVMVEPTAAASAAIADASDAEGAFADVRIEPFGPPQG
jgi:hypothetical protein